MTKDALDEVTRVAVVRASAANEEILMEFESRYQDGHSHALLAELRQRLRERLLLLVALPEVRASGK